MEQENSKPDPLEKGLFGWEPMPRRGQGRPSHVPSAQSINKVKLLLAFNRSTQQIANALGITQPTLRKHYFQELKVRAMARDALEAAMIEVLWAQAEAGNVGAVKQLQLRLDRVDMEVRARLAANDDGDVVTPKPLRPATKGKKEQAVIDATDVLDAHPLLDPLRMN